MVRRLLIVFTILVTLTIAYLVFMGYGFKQQINSIDQLRNSERYGSKFFVHKKETFRVDRIEYGSLVVSKEGDYDKYIIHLEDYFKFGIDVLPGNMIVLYTDIDDNIINVEVKP